MDLKSRIDARIGFRLKLLAIERLGRTDAREARYSPPNQEPSRDPWPGIRKDWYAENHVFLNAVYKGLFGRPPDEVGAPAWLEELRLGLPRNLLVALMLESDEARQYQFTADWHETMNVAEAVRPLKAAHKSWLLNRVERGDFIIASYMRYLGRSPSDDEIRVWSRRLRLIRFGGRKWMLRKLERSEERGAMRFDYERHIEMLTLAGLDRLNRTQEQDADQFKDLRQRSRRSSKRSAPTGSRTGPSRI